LKILHTEASTGWGGQEIRILEEASRMREMGHEVEILCDPSALMCERAQRFGFTPLTTPMNKKKLSYLPSFFRTVSRIQPDIVNTHSSTDAWMAAIWNEMRGRKATLIRTRHVSAPVKNHLSNRWLYARAHRAVATTGHWITNHLRSQFNLSADQVRTIPTGVDCSRFVPSSKQECDQFVIGITATLRSWKGHSYLIDALAELPNHVVLKIVGDGPQSANLAEQIASKGLESRIELLGFIDDPAYIFDSFDAFCLPSYANEGVPQALLQASACGLPIITTAIGGIPDLISHDYNGLVVREKSSDEIASAIRLMLSDESLRKRLGTAARDHVVQHHSMEAMCAAMLDIYEYARTS